MKTMKVLAAVAAVALPLQFAQAQDGAINAQLVFPDVGLYGYDGGMGIALGYEANLDSNISVEGEFTTTVSDPDWNLPGGVKYELSYYTLGGYAKYTADVSPGIGLYGRAGLVYWDWEESNNAGGYNFSDSEFSFSLGFGANIALSQQLDFTAGYTILDNDLNHLSAGIKYKL